MDCDYDTILTNSEDCQSLLIIATFIIMRMVPCKSWNLTECLSSMMLKWKWEDSFNPETQSMEMTINNGMIRENGDELIPGINYISSASKFDFLNEIRRYNAIRE